MITCRYRSRSAGEKAVSLDTGSTPLDVLKKADPLSVDKSIAVELDGVVWDMLRPIPDGNHEVTPVFSSSDKGLEVMRHSCAHVMAEAVKKLYPGTKLAIGPVIKDGFYYDVLPPKPISDDDLSKIEGVMKEIISKGSRFERIEMPREQALTFVQGQGEDYKAEIINQIAAGEAITFYKDGDFIDLCRGPHAPSTDWIKAFKLTKVSGAYWRGDEKNVMLTRIYGTAFDTEERLKAHFEFLEKAKEIDHRNLNKQLDLFTISMDVGPGLVLWNPNGAIIKRIIEEYWYKLHLQNDYCLVSTPHITTEELFKTSGHLQSFSENMFGSMEADNRKYRLKPMNCPFHATIYKRTLHSYRELPLRYAELGTVYRYEKGGVLHGLMRVRSFTIDDAHIFVRPDQVKEEVARIYELTMTFLSKFGFSDFDIELSTRPKEYIGTIEGWDKAISALEDVLKSKGLRYIVDEGGGAFYGPKISISIKDSLGRKWQCSTIQLDFNLPERFDLVYMDQNGRQARPLIIHRALTGSIERFTGILVEHYEGRLPFWLSPVQVKVITVSEDVIEYAETVRKLLIDSMIRVKLDTSDERLGNKIRIATGEKVPVIAVLGVKERDSATVALRFRTVKEQTVVGINELVSFLGSCSQLNS